MNRRQRRALMAKECPSAELSSAAEIPMERPRSSDCNKPKTKTLYEIAAERQAELAPHGQPFLEETERNDASTISKTTKLVAVSPDGKISEIPSSKAEATASTPDSSAEPLPPLLDTLLLSFPFTCLHFTLSFLTVHQYAQPDFHSIPTLLKQSIFVALPTLTLLIHLAHGHALPFPHLSQRARFATKTAQQVAFIITANIAGCYLIYLTNDRGYYAVMKRAPAIGTLWVWCIIELGLVGALTGVVGPAVFAWWNGYGVF
ncbi:hypothetical protein GJ744_012138 [Endocarpon pusillum]|uniref:DUF7719 domain-containing protein n=1 Tax=Endocarpon pusillum TaxID=364733 RepID=A0A8H7E4D9_9EURO|nr:hypothetical protein GJ744_012138 [Endocarpon pusillum]